ncbi:hypothetical protein HGRIS_012549 [Hohenbuehelia grisea]|uniref:Transmembrane protein 188 n=1 Tax=Hohenbuehelia grisea TaxID=104357 RepID=A0ABR3ISM6_9AGAR
MPPRLTPPPRHQGYPYNDAATYRDLLLFEERLKSNAASLQHRKSRYQLFLAQLLLIIAFLLCEVLLPPHVSLLAIPYKLLLHMLLPDLYPPDAPITLHPAFASGLLFVSLTTLVLFFASGMYTEKIAYANKYVPHANRALRSFNMYLNVRKLPLRSKLFSSPLSFFFPRPDENTAPPPRSRSPSPESQRSSSQARPSAIPIAPIPPTTNPRGELIFSSRVDKSFRESYERYRAAFERRREEKERAARLERGLFGIRWLKVPSIWQDKPDPPAVHTPSTATPIVRTPTGSISRRGGSRSGTPPASLRMRERSTSRTRASRPNTGSSSRSSTPPSAASGTPRSGRVRKESDGEREASSKLRTFALEKSMNVNIGDGT